MLHGIAADKHSFEISMRDTASHVLNVNVGDVLLQEFCSGFTMTGVIILATTQQNQIVKLLQKFQSHLQPGTGITQLDLHPGVVIFIAESLNPDVSVSQ